MQCTKVVPILRIFDYDKAIEFYVHWLGFKIDWEHRFEDNAPVYIQVSLGGITLHLSEHHGDCSPGAHLHIDCIDLKNYHKTLIAKQYKYNCPGIEKTFYDTWCVSVNDPFYNRISFNEPLDKTETGSTNTEN